MHEKLSARVTVTTTSATTTVIVIIIIILYLVFSLLEQCGGYKCYPPLNAMKGIILMVANISTICKAVNQMLYFKNKEEFCPRVGHTWSLPISTLNNLDDEIWDVKADAI